jgi:hypothetical protein
MQKPAKQKHANILDIMQKQYLTDKRSISLMQLDIMQKQPNILQIDAA